MASGTCSVGFRNRQAVVIWIVIFMNCNQRGNAETTLVLFPNLSTRTFRRHHHDRDVFTNFHSLLDNVETMGIGKTGIFFHERHDLCHHRGVLLVWSQVQDKVCCGDKFFVGAYGKTILSGILPGVSFLIYRRLPKCIGHIQAAIAKV